MNFMHVGNADNVFFSVSFFNWKIRNRNDMILCDAHELNMYIFLNLQMQRYINERALLPELTATRWP